MLVTRLYPFEFNRYGWNHFPYKISFHTLRRKIQLPRPETIGYKKTLNLMGIFWTLIKQTRSRGPPHPKSRAMKQIIVGPRIWLGESMLILGHQTQAREFRTGASESFKCLDLREEVSPPVPDVGFGNWNLERGVWWSLADNDSHDLWLIPFMA